MSWECGECSQRERDGLTISAICHHCGKPLCEKHRKRVVDDAFARESSQEPVSAFHCETCMKAHHPKAVVVPG
jgi:hypothetical protein